MLKKKRRLVLLILCGCLSSVLDLIQAFTQSSPWPKMFRPMIPRSLFASRQNTVKVRSHGVLEGDGAAFTREKCHSKYPSDQLGASSPIDRPGHFQDPPLAGGARESEERREKMVERAGSEPDPGFSPHSSLVRETESDPRHPKSGRRVLKTTFVLTSPADRPRPAWQVTKDIVRCLVHRLLATLTHCRTCQ